MSNNEIETSLRFKLQMTILGVLVMIAPAFILMVAPAPIGFGGDYVGPKGMAYLFFLLSVPAGMLVIFYGIRPTRRMKSFLIRLAIAAGIGVLALLFGVDYK